MSRSRMAWGVVLYSMWARSSWPQRSQRQRSGRGQRTSKPWPSWWRSSPVISTPEGKSISIVTLATVYHLVGAAGPISMPSSRTPWGSETGMITPESASDQVPRKSSVSHLKTEEPRISNGVFDEVGVAMIGEAGGELADDGGELLGLAEQQG